MNQQDDAPVHPLLKVQELVVVDDSGRPRGRFGKLRIHRPLPPGLDGGYGLELLDHTGAPRVAVLQSLQGPCIVFDYDGTIVQALGVRDPVSRQAIAFAGVDPPFAHGPFHTMTDLDGVLAYNLEVQDDGAVIQTGHIVARP